MKENGGMINRMFVHSGESSFSSVSSGWNEVFLVTYSFWIEEYVMRDLIMQGYLNYKL